MRIPLDHLIKVCRYRQSSDTCKYIVFLIEQDSFYCAKSIPDIRNKIDATTDMIAKGEHCEGLR